MVFSDIQCSILHWKCSRETLRCVSVLSSFHLQCMKVTANHAGISGVFFKEVMAGIFCYYCTGVLAIALIIMVRTAHLHWSSEEHCAQLSHHLDHLHLEEQKLGWASNYGRHNVSFASKSSVSEITLNDNAKIEFVPCLTCPLKGNPSMPFTEAQM